MVQRLLLIFVLAGCALGCRAGDGALLVTIKGSDQATIADVVSLVVTTHAGGREETAEPIALPSAPCAFPPYETSFGVAVPRALVGAVVVDVVARDSKGAAVAYAQGETMLTAGGRDTIPLTLMPSAPPDPPDLADSDLPDMKTDGFVAPPDLPRSPPDFANVVPVSTCTGEWCALNPFPSANRLNDIWASDPNDAWVAAGEAVLHWNGSTWSSMALPVFGVFNSIWGADANDVWAIGAASAMHWDGTKWNSYAGAYPTSDLWGLHSKSIWSCGAQGQIAHWDGSAWKKEPSTGTSEELYGIFGTSEVDVWAVGDAGTIVRRNGSGWTLVDPKPTTEALIDLWGTSDANLWAVGYAGTILHWDGDEWTTWPSGTSERLLGVWGKSQDDVWAVGDNGVAVHWDGSAWTLQTSGTTKELRAVSGSGDRVWAVGQVGEIVELMPQVAGVSATAKFRDDVRGVWAASEDNVWVVGDRGLLAQWNGSEWTKLGVAPDQTAPLFVVWGTASDDVWIGGHNVILHWHGTWTVKTTTFDVYTIHGGSADDVWAGGADGALLHWDGATWSAKASNTTKHLVDIWATSATDARAIAAESNGVNPSLHAWNGTAWSLVGAIDFASGIWASSATDYWRVGDGTIYGPSGDEWSDANTTLRSICGVSATDIWAVGSPLSPNAGIVRHYDAMANWSAATTVVRDAILLDVYAHLSSAWTVGSSGVVLKH